MHMPVRVHDYTTMTISDKIVPNLVGVDINAEWKQLNLSEEIRKKQHKYPGAWALTV